MMKQYRVSKYNPVFRDDKGRFTKEEWTSYSDIGKNVSEAEYEKVESAYIQTALKFLEEQNIVEINISYIELRDYKEIGIDVSIGTVLNLSQFQQVMKSILRDKYWAKLETDNFFIHFGYDYYMYIGVTNESKFARDFAESKGLFVENFVSPYL